MNLLHDAVGLLHFPILAPSFVPLTSVENVRVVARTLSVDDVASHPLTVVACILPHRHSSLRPMTPISPRPSLRPVRSALVFSARCQIGCA